MEVRWDDPKVQAQFEDMGSTLLKRLHPEAQRIDGSGGDEGRDVQVPTPDGLLIYELKSFTGRLATGSRKQQITRSLARAAEHSPCGWRLVVPIDPTQGELQWFRRVSEKYPFPCEWLGRTWLNTELAHRPEIQRYFLEDSNAEVVRLLKELRGEELAAEDARTALRRARAIRERLNETDPYYSYLLSIGSGAGQAPQESVLSVRIGEDRIDVVPRYATALKDRPIMINALLEFDASSIEHRDAFERGLSFGDPVNVPANVVKRLTIDAPGGLSTEYKGVEFSLESREEDLPEPIIAQVAVLAPDGESLLGAHEFRMTRRRGGQRGGVLFGSDSTGLLSLQLRGDTENKSLTASLNFSFAPVLPGVGLTAARWARQVRPPNRLRIDFVSPSMPAAEAIIDAPLVGPRLVEFYEAFDVVQKRAGISFPIPKDVMDEEWLDIRRAAQWLSAEKYQYTWTEYELPLSGASRETLEKILKEEGGTLMMTHDVSIDFRGRSLSLGRLARTFQAVATNADEVRAASARGERDIVLKLAPGRSDIVYEWLLQPGNPLLSVS